jgi:hypothetical protein
MCGSVNFTSNEREADFSGVRPRDAIPPCLVRRTYAEFPDLLSHNACQRKYPDSRLKLFWSRGGGRNQMEDTEWATFLVFTVGFSTAIVAVTACVRWLARRKLTAWTLALPILFGGAALYAISLFVALASDGTTWEKHVPLFRLGQKHWNVDFRHRHIGH